MLKDIVSIEIQGANFEIRKKTALFIPLENGKAKTNKGVLLYGRNGSGKSTIARAFRKLAGESLPAIHYVAALDQNDNQINLTEEDKKRIFVFDEDYVDKNVKIQQEGLNTIVMLGEQGGLTEKIEAAEAKRDNAKIAYENQEKRYLLVSLLLL